MRRLIGFPGQGSQKLMAGRALAEQYPNSAGRVFQQVDDILDGLFSKLCWNDLGLSEKELEHRLSLTENTQPIILACSIAVLEALKERHGFKVSPITCGALVGHSLGEYACLVASRSLDFGDAIRLVRARGLAMRDATQRWGKTPAMSAVLGLTWENAIKIESIVPNEFLCQAVCANGPEQTVFAGCDEGVTWGIAEAKAKYGAKKGLKMSVSCPFHSVVMTPAAEEFAKILKNVKLGEPSVPIVFGFDMKSHTSVDAIKFALTKGINNPVMWSGAVRKASEQFGPLKFQEFGGETLRFGITNVPGLTKAKSIKCTPDDIEGFAHE